MKTGSGQEKIVNEFISTLSHEIRTPLTSIKGFAQTMLENYDNLDDGQKKKFLNIISEQSQRLINLVENVLNIAKMEDNGLILKEIDLERTVRKTLELLKINCKDRVFIINAEKNLPSAMADYDKLQQVLTNVLDNACKYSEGEIKINITKYGKIEITDQGIGIEKEHLERIFNKFYRVGNYLVNKTQGSGLGLYIAKTLMEQMNGTIDVQSEKGQTKFTLTLPILEVEKIAKKVQE